MSGFFFFFILIRRNAIPPVDRDLSQEGDALNISGEAFTFDEEGGARGPGCEEESAKPACSSQTAAPKKKTGEERRSLRRCS